MGLDPTLPILVIDDSAAIRARMSAYLKKLGFSHVTTAANIAEGLEAFRKENSQLVFLDLVIDEERGTDFAAEALAERPLANIIIMTALPPSHEYVTSAIAEGASEYLGKPIRFSNLQTVIERVEDTLTPEASPHSENSSYM